MWSYYADGHRGIAVGIKVRKTRNHPYTVRNVAYDMEVHVDDSKIKAGPEQVALHILSQKQSAWQHEDEVRVFTRDKFVDVDIQKVCFGYYMDRTDRDLVKALVKMTAPAAELVQLERKQLDKPINTFKAKREH